MFWLGVNESNGFANVIFGFISCVHIVDFYQSMAMVGNSHSLSVCVEASLDKQIVEVFHVFGVVSKAMWCVLIFAIVLFIKKEE